MRRAGVVVLWMAMVMLMAGTPMRAVSAQSNAGDDPVLHGLSLVGPLKYPEGFPHFDYVNPRAPKGGLLRHSAIGVFDSLNPFIIKGNPAAGLGLIYDTLMTGSLDEPGSAYTLIAESVSHPPDYSAVTFILNPRARFHDGTPVTAADVAWSLQTLKQNHPFYSAYYADVAEARVLDDHRIRFEFSVKGNRELPHIMGQLPVLPAHYWRERDFSATTLMPPPGSGPYRVESVDPGRSITYRRVEDYWAADLPVSVGQNNFDRIRYDYFRDRDVALEAFKADGFDFNLEVTASKWATAYDIPAVDNGDMLLLEAPDKSIPPMQAFIFNIRREKFSDPRVREAFNLAFDFEWSNKTLFYGQYRRTDSYFDNSELAAGGIPEGLELELLEPHRGSLPAGVFSQIWTNPAGDGSGVIRERLRRARTLLEQAGWRIDSGRLVNANGDPMAVEFLLVQPNFERIVLPYIANLKRLGIMAGVRTVDVAQYRNRTDAFDFDIVITSFPQSHSPGNEQRDFWGSLSADTPGGRNLIGIRDPVVDALIDAIILAEDRAHLVAATRALDRVLLWRHYAVPQWHAPYDRLAWWKRLAHPALPGYSPGFPAIWWFDAAADAALAAEETAP